MRSRERPRRVETGGREQEPSEPPPSERPSLEDEIRLRAYYRYLEREGEPGDPVSDWLEAEGDVIGRPSGGVDARGRTSDEEAGLG